MVDVVASREGHEAAWQAEGDAYGKNTARIRDSAICILRVDISIDAADVYVEALRAPWT